MDKIKNYGLAVVKVSEKVLLIGIGLAGLWAHFSKIKDENLSTITLIIAVVAMTFGLAPMVWNYARSVWPKKVKENK